MVKYSPKDNTYKEMYLINKFEKDIMESSLQNLSNSKKDMTEQYKSPITVNSDSDKESMQTVTKKPHRYRNYTKNNCLTMEESQTFLKIQIQ